MRYLRYAFLGVLGICLITLALANRGSVTLRVLPEDLAAFTGLSFTLTLPLFVVIFAGIVGGLLIGFVWEWLREHKHRAEASAQRREKDRLAREVKRLKQPAKDEKDDVLALLEEAEAAR